MIIWTQYERRFVDENTDIFMYGLDLSLNGVIFEFTNHVRAH